MLYVFFLGTFFGNIPEVKDNFALVVMAIIGISILPGIITWIKSRKRPSSKEE